MQEHELPTWRDMFIHAIGNLDTARQSVSDAADWLRSDWRPLGSALPDNAAEARIEIQQAIRRIKNEIDSAKGLLHSTAWLDH